MSPGFHYPLFYLDDDSTLVAQWTGVNGSLLDADWPTPDQVNSDLPKKDHPLFGVALSEDRRVTWLSPDWWPRAKSIHYLFVTCCCYHYRLNKIHPTTVLALGSSPVQQPPPTHTHPLNESLKLRTTGVTLGVRPGWWCDVGELMRRGDVRADG